MKYLFISILALLLIYLCYRYRIVVGKWIDKQKDKWKRRDYYSKQKIIHIAFIVIVLIILAALYYEWFTSLSTNKRPGEITELKSILEYFEKNGGFVSFYFGLVALLTVLLNFERNTQNEVYARLYNRSKERISVLKKFHSKSNLLGEKNIYNSILDLLNRIYRSNNSDQELSLLLCSPLLDFDGRTKEINEWGDEFSHLLKKIADDRDVKVRMWVLPNNIINGSNPLKSFTEILANFGSDKDVNVKFQTMWENTLSFISTMEQLDQDNKETVEFNRTILSNIPFQILLYNSKEIKEVVVSFAGKKVLEDVHNSETFGIHSVDSDVVEAFTDIFNSYVAERRRTPIKPQHSLNVIEKINGHEDSYTIKDYLNSTCYNNMIDELKLAKTDIEVPPQTFSPAYANSSKFTSVVLKTIIGKKDKVLEIGAGTGVQSIIAFRTQIALKNKKPKVYALEMDSNGFKALQNNLIKNKINFVPGSKNGVKAINATLKAVNGINISFETNDIKLTDEAITNGKLEIIDNKSYADNKKHFEDLIKSQIDLLIADLPYVDTDAENGLERAFYDPGHYAHKSLFLYFKNSNQFRDEARLLTSFSSLGGEEDLIRFELMIREAGLFISHKQSFFEDGYEWIVYTIVKTKQDGYWKKYLNCQI